MTLFYTRARRLLPFLVYISSFILLYRYFISFIEKNTREEIPPWRFTRYTATPLHEDHLDPTGWVR